jgi:large repetitive protein
MKTKSFVLLFSMFFTQFVAFSASNAAFFSKNKLETVSPPTPVVATVISKTDATCAGGLHFVTIQGAGGTPPYTFKRRKLPNPTFGTGAQSGISPNKTFSVTAGTWEFKVTDAVGASGLVQVVFVSPMPMVVTTFIDQQISCYNYNNGIATINVFGGQPPYTVYVAGQVQLLYYNGQNTYFHNLPAGNHKPIITDANGCVATNVPSIILVEPPFFAIETSIIASPPCLNSNSGVIELSAPGEHGSYVVYYLDYYYNAYGFGNTPYKTTFSNVSAGSHLIQASDQRGCQASTMIQVDATGTFEFVSILPTDAACGEGGSVEISMSGGSGAFGGAYIYDLASGNFVGYGAEQLPDNPGLHFKMTGFGGNPIDSGAYYVYITDSVGCVATSDTIHIGGTKRIYANIYTTETITCSGKNDGQIVVNPFGGKRPFQYSLDSIVWQNDSIFDNLTANLYHIYIADAQNCVSVFEHQLNEPAPVEVIIGAPLRSCDAGEIYIMTSGGSYYYSLQQVSATDTSIKIGNPISNYGYVSLSNLDTNAVFQFTAVDYYGCAGLSEVATIPNNQILPNIAVDSIIVDNADCLSGYGSLLVKNVQGGTGLYNFQFDGSYYSSIYPDTSFFFPFVFAGLHNLRITDATYNGCYLDTIINIPSAENLALKLKGRNGFCETSSYIDYNFCGGNPPYIVSLLSFNYDTYGWTDIVESDTFLSPVHCPKNPIQIDTTKACDRISSGDCGYIVSNGSIFLISDSSIYGHNKGFSEYGFEIPTGATGIEFNWNSYYANFGSSVNFGYKINNNPIIYLPNTLSNGFETIDGLSAGDCIRFHIETVTQKSPFIYGSSFIDFSSLILHTIDTFQATGRFNNLPIGGYYYVKVTNGAGCSTNESIAVYNYAFTAYSNYQTNPSCFGEKTGFFQINTYSGSGNYTYVVDNNATIDNFGEAHHLAAGTYHVTVTDGNGCSDVATVIITEPEKLKANLTFDPIQCHGGMTPLTYFATGGTQPYSFSGQTFDVSAGHFAYGVWDAKGCQSTAEVDVPNPPIITLIVSKLNTNCSSTATGKIGVVAQGGAGGFQFQLNNGAFTTNANFTGLSAGNYVVTVKDSKGCLQTKTVTIGTNSISVIAQSTNLACAGTSNGLISLVGSNGTAPYSFKMGNGGFQNSPVFQNLSAGVYVLTAKDANGCTAFTQASVLEPAPISLQTSVANQVLGGTNGSISAAATGGTPPFLFKIDNNAFQNNGVFSNLVAGNYQISVKDANGCTKSATVSISLTNNGAITISVNQIQPVSCASNANGAILTTVSGGCNLLTYRWYRGNILVGSSEDLINVPSGEYLLFVFDNCGKTAQIEHIIIPTASAYVEHLIPDDVASCFIRYKWDSKSTATSYKIYHKKCSETVWQTQNIGLNTFYDLPSLMPATCYDFGVELLSASCPNDTILTFLMATKSASVSPPVHVTHIINSKTSATIKWDPANCAQSFPHDLVELRYRKMGVSAWTVVTLNNSSFAHTLSALTAGACYQYRLRNHFPSGVSWSNFTSIRQFCLPLSALSSDSDGESFAENKIDPNVISIEYNVLDEPEILVENNPSKLDFSLSPNPTNDVLNVHFESVDFDNTLIINVLNVAGQKMQSRILKNSPQISDEKIDVELLPTGLYFLEIQNGNLRKVVKFVKQN